MHVYALNIFLLYSNIINSSNSLRTNNLLDYFASLYKKLSCPKVSISINLQN